MSDTPAKKPWQSKTIVVAALLGILQAVVPFIPQAGSISDLIKHNGDMVTFFWMGLSLVLRLVTKDKISLKD